MDRWVQAPPSGLGWLERQALSDSDRLARWPSGPQGLALLGPMERKGPRGLEAVQLGRPALGRLGPVPAWGRWEDPR